MARPERKDSHEIKIKLEIGTYKEEFLRFEALTLLNYKYYCRVGSDDIML